MRRQYTSRQRTELIGLVSSGRATVSEAAEQLGVLPSTAYYWVRGAAAVAERGGRVRRSRVRALAAPTFVRVVPSREVQAEVLVRVGGAEIQVRRGFDALVLRAVVEALRGGDG